jgi:predicted ATPase
MERAKLIVKNFGPLKDIEIEVREMVTFIGAQASGKSTLAKLLSIFEDENFRKNEKISFEDELKKYNILSYLKEDTFIEYSNSNNISKPTTPFNLNFSSGIFTKATPAHLIEQLKKIINNPELIPNDNERNEKFKSFIKESLNYCGAYDKDFKRKVLTITSLKEQKIKIENLFFSNDNDEPLAEKHIDKILSILEKEHVFKNYLLLYETFVEIFPNIFLYDSIYIPSERNFLHLIAENTLGLINNNIQIPKHLLSVGQEYEKAIQTIKELPLTIIDKNFKYKREGKTSYIYHNESEKVDLLESASGLQSIIPILLLVEYSKSLKEKYNFNFVVEEPELNLYPKAQHELIKYLVKNCLFERKNLILTTHSPFVLASINNLLLAFDKGKTNPKEVNKIIKKESWLDPKNFIAYELKNGKAKKIMDDKLGQIKENMIDGVSDSFADEFDKLLDL